MSAILVIGVRTQRDERFGVRADDLREEIRYFKVLREIQRCRPCTSGTGSAHRSQSKVMIALRVPSRQGVRGS